MTIARTTPPAGTGSGWWFEDFRVGERFVSGARVVTAQDLTGFTAISGDDHPLHSGPDAMLQGPFGIAVALGLMHGFGLHGDAVHGLLDTHWSYRLPVRVGDRVRLEATIVRCRRTSRGDRGVVTRHMRLVDDDGRTVQEGTTATLVGARGAGPDPAGRAFGTVAWGQALVAALPAAFAGRAADWDGTIGLRAGDHEVHLRLYRGTILEVVSRSPNGASFVVEADELTWIELVTTPSNEFTRYAMAGRTAVRGNGYEYRRLTRAIFMILEAAREIA